LDWHTEAAGEDAIRFSVQFQPADISEHAKRMAIRPNLIRCAG
jgi:hypothetical protein